MSRCTSCGFDLKPNQKVCPACGKVVVTVAAPSKGGVSAPKIDEGNVSVFMKYADLLDNDELYNAAICKLNGIGVSKSFKEAMEMFKILAFRGYVEGMYKYAECLLKDNPPDEETACRWLSQAASEGHKPSKLLLGSLGQRAKVVAPTQGRIAQVSGLESLVAAALPSIVSIEVVKQEKGQKVGSAGSGFIIEGGYVITNAHVVGENPVYIVARFEPGVDKTSYNLMPLAIAPSMDIAVLRFSGLADSKFTAQNNLELRVDQVAYGEDVYTIGNPLGIGLSVSKGVVSCPNRRFGYPPAVPEVIQTDITANHGNSGGALLDMNNNVLGMITFTPSRSEGGMGMCVPSSSIVEVLNKLNEIIKKGK